MELSLLGLVQDGQRAYELIVKEKPVKGNNPEAYLLKTCFVK